MKKEFHNHSLMGEKLCQTIQRPSLSSVTDTEELHVSEETNEQIPADFNKESR